MQRSEAFLTYGWHSCQTCGVESEEAGRCLCLLRRIIERAESALLQSQLHESLGQLDAADRASVMGLIYSKGAEELVGSRLRRGNRPRYSLPLGLTLGQRLFRVGTQLRRRRLHNDGVVVVSL